MKQIIICPQCGQEANYIITGGFTVSACSYCHIASILETNIIVKVDPDKLLGQAATQRNLLMIALTAKALYENWDIITRTYVPMAER